MEHWDAVLTPEHRTSLPRCHGLRPNPSESSAQWPEHIPETDWAYSESEPTPVAVRRGTAQVFTQSMLHSVRVPLAPPSSRLLPGPFSHPCPPTQAWPNSDTEPRKGFIIAFSAAEVPVGFVWNRCEGLRHLFPLVRESAENWCPGREHIVPAAGEFKHFVTGPNHGDPLWPETFIEGKTPADRQAAKL